MNTSITDNERFYGKAYERISENYRTTGLTAAGWFRSNNYTEQPSILSLEYEKQRRLMISFTLFMQKERQVQKPEEYRPPSSGSGVTMKFNIETTPEARFQLIYNSQIGDMIRAGVQAIYRSILTLSSILHYTEPIR